MPTKSSKPTQLTLADQDLIATLQSLIQKPSVTPDDAGCIPYLIERLTRLGFECQSFTLNGVTNLIAVKDASADELSQRTIQSGKVDINHELTSHKNSKPRLAFIGHTDVVPPGNDADWCYPPFAAHIDGQSIYGRGAVDMKSGIACMLNALEQLSPSAYSNGSMMLLITSDEEGVAEYGTRSIIEYLKQQDLLPDACLVGEPTARKSCGDTIKIGRRGSISGSIQLSGIAGHVAYPQQIENPIHQMGEVIARLNAIAWDEGSLDFPGTSLQITRIESGEFTDNISPAKCKISFNIRYSHLWCEQSLDALIHQQLIDISKNFEITWERPCTPYFSAPDQCRSQLLPVLEQAIIQSTGRYPVLSTSGGTSDGRFAAQICNDVFELGIPNKTIHQVNERARLDDIFALRDIYLKTLELFFNVENVFSVNNVRNEQESILSRNTLNEAPAS